MKYLAHRIPMYFYSQNNFGTRMTVLTMMDFIEISLTYGSFKLSKLP